MKMVRFWEIVMMKIKVIIYLLAFFVACISSCVKKSNIYLLDSASTDLELNYSTSLLNNQIKNKYALKLKSALDSQKLPTFIVDSAAYCQNPVNMHQFNVQFYSELIENLNDSDFYQLSTLVINEGLNYFIPIIHENSKSIRNGMTLDNLLKGHHELRKRKQVMTPYLDENCLIYRKLDTTKYYIHLENSILTSDYLSNLRKKKRPGKIMKIESSGEVRTWVLNSVSNKYVLGTELALNKRSVKCINDTLLIEDLSIGLYQNNFRIFVNKEWFIITKNEIVSVKFQRDNGKTIFRREKYFLRSISFLELNLFLNR